MSATSPRARRTDLDLLRILVCGAVILAHALLIFAAEPRYHVKSAVPWPVATVAYEALRIGTLAIFFTLAGWSAVASLRRRTAGRYVQDRLARVLGELGQAVEARARDARGHAARDSSADHDRRSDDEALA